jgi:PAS domain S-box-containing protein
VPNALLRIVPLAASAFAYALATLIDPLLGLSDGQPAVIQLGLGTAFAIVLLSGMRHLVAIMISHLALALAIGQPPLQAFASAAFVGLLVGAGCTVLHRFPMQPFPRMRADHYVWFLGVALVLAVSHGALQAWQPGTPFYVSDWTLHSAASFAGTVLVVQLVAGWLARVELRGIAADLPSSLPWFVLTLAIAGAIFLRVLDGPEPFMFLLPAALVWSAFRLKVRWMSLLLILMHALAFHGTAHGLGPFGNDTPLSALMLLQTFIITMSIVPYSLSITLNERAAASRRARNREAQLLDLFDGSIQGILIHRRFRPLYANRRAAELLGFQSVADLMNCTSLAGMIAADDIPVIDSDSNRRQLAAGRILPVQLNVVRIDGRTRTFDSMIRQIAWSGEPAIQATFIDVTEDLRARREQRSRLERQERQLAAVMRLSTDSGLSSGRDGALTALTEAAADALDVDRASVWDLDVGTQRLLCVDLFDRQQLQTDHGHSTGHVLDAERFRPYFDALRSGRVIEAADARSHPVTAAFAEGYLEQQGVTSMLDAPVFVDGRLAGVVCLEHRDGMREWAYDEARFSGGVGQPGRPLSGCPRAQTGAAGTGEIVRHPRCHARLCLHGGRAARRVLPEPVGTTHAGPVRRCPAGTSPREGSVPAGRLPPVSRRRAPGGAAGWHMGRREHAARCI